MHAPKRLKPKTGSFPRFSLLNKTSRPVRDIPFARIARAVLGPSYELSVVLLTSKESLALTRKTKKKRHASNVLSFPLSKNSGEIVLCPAVVLKEARGLGISSRDRLALLFIHGLLHLKGHRHGVTMT